jgi:hypothetical protein
MKDEQGRRVFQANFGQFVIVVEGVPGFSGAAAGTSLGDPSAMSRPDLQIENSRDMGNGSLAVCDATQNGGVPGVPTPDFSLGSQSITAALNDFACRFDPGISADAPCTLLDTTRVPGTITTPKPSVQFCDLVQSNALFLSGDSILTVRLRDVQGNLGPPAQIVVHVP